MSTTTIRIDDGLKERIAAVAEREGTTAHAFMLDAISRTVEQVEAEQAFRCDAAQRWEALQATGKTIPWDAARAYLEARARGERARKPSARKIAR